MAKKSKITTPKPKAATAKPRTRKLTGRAKKQFVRTTKRLPNSFKILREALRHIRQNFKLYAGILLVFAPLYVVLVKGIATEFQLTETNDAITEAVGGDIDAPTKAVALLGALFGTTGSTSGEAAGVYQIVLFIILSLAIIWALRQTFDGRTKLRIRDAYYKSTYPFIPYVLVGVVVLLQCLPAILTLSVYSLVTSEGIAVGTFEQAVWILILAAGLLVSVYLLSSSLFASYIVTLPGMTPFAALRSARKLVRYRRWSVIRKLVLLPVVAFIALALVFLPLVYFAPVLAEVLFMAAGLLLLLVAHAYMYVLYRELL